MPQRPGRRRAAMYNTPHIRNGGFGALQVEAVTNRPLSIARRHLAASQLRMRDIEPDELSSSEWVRFLVMEGAERDRFISDFARRRRDSSGSASSCSSNEDYGFSQDRQTQYDKAEEARLEAEEARREGIAVPTPVASTPAPSFPARGSTPIVSMWARHLDELESNERTDSEPTTYNAMRPMHARRGVDEPDAPPAYHSVVRPGTPPPAYEPRSDDEGDGRRPSRLRRWSSNMLSNRLSPSRN